MRSWHSDNEEETRTLGAALASELEPDGVLLLTGDLGAGKTVLVQGLAQGLGLDPCDVKSPTFTVIREHAGGRSRLTHIDLYRLEADEVAATGVEEALAGPGVKAVEWAERLPFPVPGGLCLEILRRRTGRSIRELPGRLVVGRRSSGAPVDPAGGRGTHRRRGGAADDH